MKTLAFDTSTKFLSIALLDGEKVAGKFHEEAGITHSELLMPTIGKMLKKLKWDIKDIGLVAVGLGPGSFTGLRIAVATAKGLAAVNLCKLVGVPTMDAMVLNWEKGGFVAPLLDARKEKVYSCMYDYSREEPVRISDYLLLPLSDLLKGLQNEVTFWGDGVEKFKPQLKRCPLARIDETADSIPRAWNVGKLGIRIFEKNGAVDPSDIDPLYLHAKECNITGIRS